MAEKLAVGVGAGACKSTRYKAKPAHTPIPQYAENQTHSECKVHAAVWVQADMAEKLAVGVGAGAYKSTRYKAKPYPNSLKTVRTNHSSKHTCICRCCKCGRSSSRLVT